MQRRLVLGSLVLSSGAFLTLVTTIVPVQFSWIKPFLAFLAAALSFWSLIAKNERNSIDSSDLHFRLNVLAMDYRHLWSDVYSDNAQVRLVELQKREAEISKSSTSFPEDIALMEQCQDNVVMHHQNDALAV